MILNGWGVGTRLVPKLSLVTDRERLGRVEAMRHSSRRARWYLIACIPPLTGPSPMDGDEVVECWTWTRRGARRLAEAFDPPIRGGGYRIERKSIWNEEHQ